MTLLNSLNPFDYPELYSATVLGDTKSPGTVTLSGHERKAEWEVTKAKGTTGAATKLVGMPPTQFTATYKLSADSQDTNGEDDFTRWDRYQAKCESTINGPSPAALPIYHPDLARNGITEVVLVSIGGMSHDDNGGATVSVVYSEFRPEKPKPVTGTKAGTSVAAAKGVPPKRDPNAEAKKELASLVEKAKAP